MLLTIHTPHVLQISFNKATMSVAVRIIGASIRDRDTVSLLVGRLIIELFKFTILAPNYNILGLASFELYFKVQSL